MTPAASLLALALSLLTQIQSIPDPVRWSLGIKNQRALSRGAVVQVDLTAAIQPGWRLYAMAEPEGGPIATEISLPAGQPFTFAKPIAAPKAHLIFDRGFGMSVQLYTGSADFVLPIKVAETAQPGAGTMTVQARYQCCNENLCLPPHTVKATLAVKVR
jgi:thiol:disulfide interchange protein DsbD